MTNGYIYCFSNPSMPDIMNVGMTYKTPEDILNEANASAHSPPTPFKIEFTKYVTDAQTKIQVLQTLLEQYTLRLRGDYFRVSLGEMGAFFDLMD